MTPKRDATAEDSFRADLRALRDRAGAQIERLDEERRSLQRFVASADRYLDTGDSRRKKDPRSADPTPLALIQEHPGIRSSMIGQLLQREASVVASEIEELRSDGRVRRVGLGWQASP